MILRLLKTVCKGIHILPLEGSRWFTLVRSGRISQEVPNILTNVFNANSKLLWPISETSLRQNENLTQNGAY